MTPKVNSEAEWCWAVVGRVDNRSQPGKRPFANYWCETISILSCRWKILVGGLWANPLVSLSFSFSVCKMGIVETFISQAYREEYIRVCKQWNNTEYGVHQDSCWSRSPPRIKGEKSLEWLLATGGQEQTKDLDREAVRDSGPASLCICSHSVFLVFLISSLSPSQWLLIPRVWATRHSHMLLKYLGCCLFSAPWQLSGLGEQKNNYDSDQLLLYLVIFCLWDASCGAWSARLPGPFLWGM